MKKVLLIILLASCSNPKEKLVEQQKKLTEQISFYDMKQSLFNSDAKRFAMLKRRALTQPEIDTVSRMTDSADYFALKKAHLRGQYDSLEMELKKY